MTKLGSPLLLAAALSRAVSHAESTDQRSREILKTIERVVKGNLAFVVEQPHQQAVSDAVAHLSLLQTEVGQRRKQLNLIVKELHKVEQILRLATAPGGAASFRTSDDGKVVSLLHRRLRRHGGDRLIADMVGRIERLSDEIDLLNQTIEAEFNTLSDIIHR